jgi:hypothetical protein
LNLISPLAAIAAALALSGCAGADAVARRDLDLLRAEVQALRQENAELVRAVGQLSSRLEAWSSRSDRSMGEPARAAAAPIPAADSDRAGIPDGLAVVKVEPPKASRAPPVPTTTPLVEPDTARLEAIARKSGRDLVADSENELRSARRREPLARAHALEDFVSRYPRHPQAGGALLEASMAYAEAGKADPACTLGRRVVEEYPASDQVSEALLQLANCEGRKGSADLERRLLTRVVNDFPSSPAARRARERLASISGRPGADPAPGVQARSGP